VRKAVMILLALAAIALLPRTARREARALELIALLSEVMIARMSISGPGPATSKTVATEQRAAALEKRAGTMQSQRGTTSAAANLGQTQTGSPQAGGPSYLTSSAVTGGATIQTGNPNGANIGGSTVAAHTHGYGHIHDIAHFHFTQLEGDFNALVATVNQIRSALIAAQIL
jgi:hypothetical protein